MPFTPFERGRWALYFATARRMLYPTRCELCARLLGATERGVCHACRRGLKAIAPPVCRRCSRPLAPYLPAHVCKACRRTPSAISETHCAIIYEGPARTLLQKMKFASRPHLATAFEQALARAAARLHACAADCIVPVPQDLARTVRRSFQPSLLLAKALARRLGLPVHPFALRRRLGSRAQSSLTRNRRPANALAAFRKGLAASQVKAKTVLLVDDIRTSGATLEACAALLKAAGARRVVAFALARTPDRAHA